MTRLTQQDLEEAAEILRQFNQWESEFDSLMHASDPRVLDRADIPGLQSRLSTLKASIKAAAKYGTLSGLKHDHSEMERCFFDPAARRAAAHFRAATNSNPLKKNWVSELYDSRDDISYYRFQLEKFLKDSTTK